MQSLKQILVKLIDSCFYVSTGSLSLLPFDSDLCRLLKSAGQDSIIFAPETCERLRKKIGKGSYANDSLMEWADKAPKFGLKFVLYLMVGIPGETDVDLDDLGRMLYSIQKVLTKNGTKLELHINQAFPKLHTPFEWKRPLTSEQSYRQIKRVIRHLAGDPNRDYTLHTVSGSTSELLQMWLYSADCNVANSLVRMSMGQMPPKELQKKADSVANSRPFTDVAQLPWRNIVFTDHSILKQRYEEIDTL